MKKDLSYNKIVQRAFLNLLMLEVICQTIGSGFHRLFTLLPVSGAHFAIVLKEREGIDHA